MLEELNNDKQNSGVLVASDGKNRIQIAEIDFLGGNSLPIVQKYRDPYTLPEEMTCFKGVIIDDSFTVTVTCQSPADENGTIFDHLCQLKADSTDPVCFSPST